MVLKKLPGDQSSKCSNSIMSNPNLFIEETAKYIYVLIFDIEDNISTNSPWIEIRIVPDTRYLDRWFLKNRILISGGSQIPDIRPGIKFLKRSRMPDIRPNS